MLMAIYLLLANLLYGGHDEEVFSSQAIIDYKCFARFHLSKDGVKVYPIGLKTVPKDWKPVASATNVKKSGWSTTAYEFDLPDTALRAFEPADGTVLQPQLIENPIDLKP
jgi:hypothetical protein